MEYFDELTVLSSTVTSLTKNKTKQNFKNIKVCYIKLRTYFHSV